MDGHRDIQTPILTEAETIQWLRLDGPDGPKDPAGTLKYYQSQGLLRPVRIGRKNRYYLPELERFLERLLERGDERS